VRLSNCKFYVVDYQVLRIILTFVGLVLALPLSRNDIVH